MFHGEFRIATFRDVRPAHLTVGNLATRSRSAAVLPGLAALPVTLARPQLVSVRHGSAGTEEELTWGH